MKYTKARELISEAIELLSEASMEHDKPSTNKLFKPTKKPVAKNPVAKPVASPAVYAARARERIRAGFGQIRKTST